MTTANLGLDQVTPNQSNKTVTLNKINGVLDNIVQLSVLDKDLTTTPGSPSEGDRYIVAATATGVWAGNENNIAYYQAGTWNFYIPRTGFTAYIVDEDKFYYWNGSIWVDYNLLTDAEKTSLLAMIASGLDGLTAGEVTQLSAIDSVTINNTQWSYLGNSDQGIATSDTVSYVSLTTDSIIESTPGNGVSVQGVVIDADGSDFGGGVLSNIGDPVLNTDVVNVQYMVSNNPHKSPVAVATTGNGVLSTDFENGDSVDDYVLVTGDRILIKDQTAGAENGIYIVNSSGAPTRAIDNDASNDIIGSTVRVLNGTVNAGTDWMCSNATLVLETDPITYTQENGVQAHNDLSGLQGGTTGQYYHLTSAEHTATQTMITAGLDNLTSGEVTQLLNIGATTISATQWGYLGELNQSLTSTSSPTFGTPILTGFNMVNVRNHQARFSLGGAGTGGKWFEFGTITFNAQFQLIHLRGIVSIYKGANDSVYPVKFSMSASQQAALGSAPVTTLMYTAQGPVSDIKVRITQNDATATVIKFYVWSDVTFTRVFYDVQSTDPYFVPTFTAIEGLDSGTDLVNTAGFIRDYQQANIADPGNDLGEVRTAVIDILNILENLGFMAPP